MNSMQSDIASVLWVSIGATSGLGLPADECLLHERRAFATLLSRLLRKFKGESCDLFGSLNPQHPERPLFPAAFLLTEFCVWEMALLIMLGLLFFVDMTVTSLWQWEIESRIWGRWGRIADLQLRDLGIYKEENTRTVSKIKKALV